MSLLLVYLLPHNSKKVINKLLLTFFPLQDSHIYATIKGSFTHKFRGLLLEGDIYMVKNFSVQKNKKRRRIVAENKLMITFFANTIIKVVTDNALASQDISLNFSLLRNLKKELEKILCSQIKPSHFSPFLKCLLWSSLFLNW